MSHGRFVWYELITSDVEDAIAFWGEVAGFGVQEADMGPSGKYRMFERGGKTHAGVVPPQMAGVPPHWLSYLGVDDVDARHAAVQKRGGRAIVAPMDIPTVGRFSIVADPEGAVFALFRSESGADMGSTAFHWTELWAENAEDVLPFYRDVFGFGATAMPMPMGPYHILELDGQQVGGLMTSTQAKAPPMWLPYIEVDDADAAVERVRRNRGAVHAEPMSVENVGRFAIVADRQGAVVGLIQPSR